MNVLVVNNYLMGDTNPVGFTMKNMLYGMPNVRFLQYCIDYRDYRHEKMTDAIFSEVSDSLAYSMKRVLKKGKQTAAVSTAEMIEEKKKEQLTTAGMVSARGQIARGIFYAMPCRVSRKNLEIIRKFQPDVIYTMAENIRVINQCIKLAKLFHIPIVFHCMDDWKATAYTGFFGAGILHRYLLWRFRRMHEFSVENIGICQKMADYYSETFGKPYSFAGNCVYDFNDEPYHSSSEKPLKLVYSGSLHYHRGDALVKISEMVESLNREGYPTELDVYAPEDHIFHFEEQVKAFAHASWMPYSYPQSKKMENFKKADLFLHVESDDPDDMKFITYSFSTKLPEYFAVGRGVVAYGPKELASISYVEDVNCGWQCDQISDLKNMIISLHGNPQEREEKAHNAQMLARKGFSQEVIQKRIYNVLKRSAEQWREE